MNSKDQRDHTAHIPSRGFEWECEEHHVYKPGYCFRCRERELQNVIKDLEARLADHEKYLRPPNQWGS